MLHVPALNALLVWSNYKLWLQLFEDKTNETYPYYESALFWYTDAVFQLEGDLYYTHILPYQTAGFLFMWMYTHMHTDPQIKIRPGQSLSKCQRVPTSYHCIASAHMNKSHWSGRVTVGLFLTSEKEGHSRQSCSSESSSQSLSPSHSQERRMHLPLSQWKSTGEQVGSTAGQNSTRQVSRDKQASK